MKGIERGTLVLVLSTVAVIAVIAGGLWAIGSPSKQRMLKLDERRVNDLQSIASRLDVYWIQHRSLPDALDALAGEPGLVPIPVDPVRGEPYSYRLLGKQTYELCATFDVASEYASGNPWAHDAGPYCFELEMKDLSGAYAPLRSHKRARL